MGFLSKVTKNGPAAWEELIEPNPSPTGVFSRENRTITRSFRVPVADTAALVDECFPSKAQFGEHPTFPYLFVENVSFGPMPGHSIADDNGQSVADYYLITITYTPIIRNDAIQQPDPTQPNDYLTGNVSLTTETMTLPNWGGLKWASTGTDIKEPGIEPFIVIPVTQFTLQVPDVTRIPWAAMRRCRGRINSDFFFNSPPETILYNGMSVSYKFSEDGTRKFDIEHSFSERVILWKETSQLSVYGWNHFYNESTKKFDKITNKDGFPLFDTTPLFPQLMVR